MQSTQKTFSVALSRDMVPTARIIAYYIINGEVVADALNFFVNGTRMNDVDVRVNLGKDFSRDTIEISGRTEPSSYIAFSGLDYDFWVYDTTTFFTEYDVSILILTVFYRFLCGWAEHKLEISMW